MIISLIAAMDKNRIIGNDNRLPWHLPADLKHFKAITLNKPIIMGRKTFDSIGKPLPQRRNMVISRQKKLNLPGCEVFSSLSDAIKAVDTNEEVMMIGGESIFRESLSLADRLYLTIIDHEFEGDTVFPQWDKKAWKIISSETHQSDERNRYGYTFIQLEKTF
ncbi:type 3 dihydrofolate reductase [Candidiatus Paracoxiella cheracis]|uniref:type 3 dihydrofolate reductase n=1 Tax=Candidiatus Paracoxiella cheracis TaxID=3405120 RepID=UPI003BF5B0DC